MKKLISLILFTWVSLGFAQEPFKATFIDVGAGQSVILDIPPHPDKPQDTRRHYIIFDFGGGKIAIPTIKERIPQGSIVDLVVFSHTDADHISHARYLKPLFKSYFKRVDNSLRTAFPKSLADQYKKRRRLLDPEYISTKKNTKTWVGIDYLMRNLEHCSDYTTIDLAGLNPSQQYHEDGQHYDNVMNLGDCSLFGRPFQFGAATIRILAGFANPPFSDESLDDSGMVNAVSLALVVEYAGKKILLTGDTGGHEEGGDMDGPAMAGERFMLRYLSEYLDVDVLQLAHHGGDDATSMEFLEASSPEYVVVPAGNKHRHPHLSTMRRVMEFVPQENVFRTDLGPEGYEEPRAQSPGEHQIEYQGGANYYAHDEYKRGRDHVNVHIDPNGDMRVFHSGLE